jgi:hypothetical protein
MTRKKEIRKDYQIRNMPVELRKAIKVAAALEGKYEYEYVIKWLRWIVREKSGVIIEKGDELET